MNFSLNYNNALEYAAWLHRAQVRKGTQTPYITHPVAVSLLAIEHGATESEAIAALLHDALEDGPQYSGRSLTDIQNYITHHFGLGVLEIVAGCTQIETEQQNWWERKQAYIDHLLQTSPSVHLVSCCDKLHNLLCILRDYEVVGKEVWQRFSQGREGVMFYYPALARAFAEVGVCQPLLSRLQAAVVQLEKVQF